MNEPQEATMKRTKFAAALAVLTLLTTLTGCGQAKEADGALEPVTLNEGSPLDFLCAAVRRDQSWAILRMKASL